MISKIATINGTKYLVREDFSRESMFDFYGTSGDTKPTQDIENASVFYEMDTQKVFMFDADSNAWLEQ